MLYNESDETNIATFTKEGASRKYYTSFYSLAQLCVTSRCLLFYVRNQGSSFRPFRSPIYSPTTLIFLTAPKLSGGLRSVRITPRSSEANVTELTFPNFE